MNGCRSLTDEEIFQTLPRFNKLRDKVLFLLGIKTGFRITELLGIRVLQVYQHSCIVDRLRIYGTKNGESREVPLHPDVKGMILELILEDNLTENDFLFQSRNGWNKPLSRHQAWAIMKSVFLDLKLQGKLATHSMRKSFANRVYKRLDYDLVRTQKALGHKSITSTISYLPVDQEEIDEAILA